MLVEIILSILGLILAAYTYFWTVSYKYWKKLGVPIHRDPSFPWGTLAEAFSKKVDFTTFTMKIAEETKFAPFIGAYSLNYPLMIIQDADLVKAMTVKDFDYFVNRLSKGNVELFTKTNHKADHLMMTQMTNARGEKWKNLRTTFTPIFTSGKMKAMMVFINETGKRLISALDKVEESGEAFEAKSYLGKFSMDTIASCAFGVDPKVYSGEKSIFVENANELFRQDFKMMLKFLLLIVPYVGPFIFRALKLPVQSDKSLFFYDIIMKTLEQRKQSKTKRNDLIDMMLDAVKGELEDDQEEEKEQFEKDAEIHKHQANASLDEEAIVATALVIMVAGYDTTGSTLSFACYELAKNIEVQEKLRDEISEIFCGKENEEDLSYEDIKKMTYMDQVLEETLRLHTPIGALQRATEKDYKIPGSDVVLKAGVDILINVSALHFNPKHYRNPHNFDPDHFTPEAKATRHPCAYMPFGQGPRGCIGMRFALLEAKLALAKIILRYNILLSDQTKEPLVNDPAQAITYAKDGIYLNLERR